jgi:hypothetical protein
VCDPDRHVTVISASVRRRATHSDRLSVSTNLTLDTRILLVLLMDRDSRPTPKDMKLWVDVVRFVKQGARGGAFGFFTYMELSE